MNLKKIITFLVALLLFSSVSLARSLDDDEAFEFAGFIHGLIETTQGLNGGKTCAFGNDKISKILSNRIKNFAYVSGGSNKYSSCKAIYVAGGEERSFRLEIDRMNRKKILTVAIFDGFVEMDGMIQVQIGRRNFELILNSKTAKDAGIKLSALATSLVIN